MFKQLANIRATGQGSVTYSFEDGTKQVANINTVIFYNEKGKQLNLNNVMEIFQSTAHDLRAKSFNF